MANFSEDVPGYAELAQFYGGEFPSFHDSEIITLRLDRTGVSHLSVRLVGRRRTISELGTDEWVPLVNVVVTFFLEEVDDLELQGFSVQNVIAGLTLEHTASGFRIELWPCFGLAGWLNAKQVRIGFNADPGGGRTAEFSRPVFTWELTKNEI